MPFLYRATPLTYMKDYSGQGASFRNGARWNRPRQAVLYFATNPSLARLEMANYIPTPRLTPKHYVLAQYWLEDHASIEVMSLSLPEDWDCYPYPMSTQRIGGDWLESARSLCLRVPSVSDVLQVDHCMVINPLHADIKLLSYVKHTTELYNPRAFVGI